MSFLFILSALFFVFPLLSPAVGVVLYPFLLQGLLWGLAFRFRRRHVTPLTCAAIVAIVAIAIDAASAIRLLAFACALYFLHKAAKRPDRLDLLLRFATWHALVVLLQFVLVLAGIEVDFSSALRAVYGPLLPPTGVHIDYNAFSQFDLFLPRVAGLSREPAFASILFVGFAFLASHRQRPILVAVFFAAALATLSKVVFPLLFAALLAWRPGRPSVSTPRLRRFTGNLMAFVALHVLLAMVFRQQQDLIEFALGLDASFFHRLIGIHTLAVHPEQLQWIGSSYEALSSQPSFADYEFVDDRRAFLDGTSASKLAVDFGLLALLPYALTVAALCRHWRSALAIGVGGLFINLTSVSPATVMLFWLLSGLYVDALAQPGHATRPVRRMRSTTEDAPRLSGA